MKRIRKVISVLLTLAMMLGLLLPMGAPAMAVTENTLSSVPTVANDFKGLISTLTIAEDGATNEDFQVNKSFIVTLPENVKFAVYQSGRWVSVNDATGAIDGNTLVTDGTVPAVPFIQTSAGTTVTATFSSERSLFIKFNAVTVAKDYIKINLFGIVDGSIGDLKVNIDPLDSGISGGDIIVGRAASGSVEGTVLNVENVGQENNVLGGVIRLTETTAGALENGDQITLKLNNGFKWNAATVVTGNGGLVTANVPYAITAGNERELKITLAGIPNGTSTRGIIEITPHINVDSTANVGDVEVGLSGDNVTSSTLTIATYADYGIKVSAKTTPEVLSGAFDEEIGTLVVEETVKGSLVPGRKITMELPDNVKFQDVPDVKIISGSAVLSGNGAIVSDDRNKYEINVGATPSTSPSKYEFEFKHVNLSGNFTGDIPVKVYGSAIGDETEAVIGSAIAPITANVESKDVKLGMANQEGSDIVITENVDGAIQDKNIDTSGATIATVPVATGEIVLSIDTEGVKFSNTPKVEVTEGNLQVESISLVTGTGDTKASIKIKGSSTKPSTIKVSNVNFTVDRTVPVGGVKVKIYGSAINQTYVAGASETYAGFDVATVVAVYPANVVNAAPSAGSASFNIGSTIYTVDGVAKVMDAAPYIKDSRTYVPVRFLAMALGVAENNIGFENGVVTLTKGDVTVKLTIGDSNISVNDAVTAMDVAPEVVNGRTMLPARFVGEALGAQVGFGNGQVVISY